MAYGPGENDMTAICCQQLCTAKTAVLEQHKGMFVKGRRAIKKIM
jgi:hypothetical protein